MDGYTTYDTTPVSKLFPRLDADFIDIKSIHNDSYTYKASDILIQSTWELPIIIQWPNSTIKFEFTTKCGDICFGIVFVPALDEGQTEADVQVIVLDEMGRVPSEYETITGEFQPPCEGVVFFMWDNKFDWYANKKLAYSIDVFQPSFTTIEEERLIESHGLLSDCVQDIETASIKLADIQDYIVYTSDNIDVLDEQIREIELKLSDKWKHLDVLQEEEDVDVCTINSNYDILDGVCIRCLDKHLLGHVLSYLDANGSIRSVCTYWSYIITNAPTSSSSSSIGNLSARSAVKKRSTKIVDDFNEKDDCNEAFVIQDVRHDSADKYIRNAIIELHRISAKATVSVGIGSSSSSSSRKVCCIPTDQEEVLQLQQCIARKEIEVNSKHRNSNSDGLIADIEAIYRKMHNRYLVHRMRNNSSRKDDSDSNTVGDTTNESKAYKDRRLHKLFKLHSKVSKLSVEKDKLQSSLDCWEDAFSRKHGKPSNSEEQQARRLLARDINEDLKRVSINSKVFDEKLSIALKDTGITVDELLLLLHQKRYTLCV